RPRGRRPVADDYSIAQWHRAGGDGTRAGRQLLGRAARAGHQPARPGASREQRHGGGGGVFGAGIGAVSYGAVTPDA
nr:hypothetical protein [Tanacetum cinerariifolium]